MSLTVGPNRRADCTNTPCVCLLTGRHWTTLRHLPFPSASAVFWAGKTCEDVLTVIVVVATAQLQLTLWNTHRGEWLEMWRVYCCPAGSTSLNICSELQMSWAATDYFTAKLSSQGGETLTLSSSVHNIGAFSAQKSVHVLHNSSSLADTSQDDWLCLHRHTCLFPPPILFVLLLSSLLCTLTHTVLLLLLFVCLCVDKCVCVCLPSRNTCALAYF